MPGKKSKNLRAVFDLVDDNSVQNVEVSVLNAKLGEYVSIANVKESSASEYNPRNPELQDYNRFKLVDEKASSYQLLLPAKVTNLQSPYRGYLRVAFDCGRPFTDQMSCSEL